jgi:hypothetical protein
MRLAICLVLALCVGCTTAESLIKAGFEMGWNAGEAVIKDKLRGIPDEFLAGAKKYTEEKIEEAMVAVGEKTNQGLNTGVRWMFRSIGIDLNLYDYDGDGNLSDAEFKAACEDAEKQEDKPWYAAIALFLATAGFTGGKSVRRWLKTKREAEIDERLEE